MQETAARVKLTKSPTIFGGTKGQGRLSATAFSLELEDGRRLQVRLGDLRRMDFNSLNGLWTLFRKDGAKLYVQVTGLLFSVGDRASGRALNEALKDVRQRLGLESVQV